MIEPKRRLSLSHGDRLIHLKCEESQTSDVSKTSKNTEYPLMTGDERKPDIVKDSRTIGMYRLFGDLGSGNFSRVKLGLHHVLREKVAVKIINRDELDYKLERFIHQEIRTMQALRHDSLVRLYEVIETRRKLFLILEWARAGDLYHKVTLKGCLMEKEAFDIYYQIINGLHFMHSQGFVHRDIKAENILFFDAHTCKIGDFGFSTPYVPRVKLTSFCGSPPYAAPELFHLDSYEGPPVDIWSSGIVLYFMVQGCLPFMANNIHDLKKIIMAGTRPSCSAVTRECNDLLYSIFSQDPDERITMDKIFNHEWIKRNTRGTSTIEEEEENEGDCKVPGHSDSEEESDIDLPGSIDLGESPVVDRGNESTNEINHSQKSTLQSSPAKSQKGSTINCKDYLKPPSRSGSSIMTDVDDEYKGSISDFKETRVKTLKRFLKTRITDKISARLNSDRINRESEISRKTLTLLSSITDINESTILKEKEKVGSKSQIIGMYNILMHRMEEIGNQENLGSRYERIKVAYQKFTHGQEVDIPFSKILNMNDVVVFKNINTVVSSLCAIL